jgi:hypothetical protein
MRHPPDESMSDLTAGVYASSHNCDRSLGRMSPGYRGELDLVSPEQEIRVATSRPVFFRFTYYADARTPKVCWVGFRPRADESYVLEFSLADLRVCDAAVSSPQGPVELLPTASCAEGEL